MPVYACMQTKCVCTNNVSFMLQDVRDKIKTFDGPLSGLIQEEQKLRRDDETIRQEKVKYMSCAFCTYATPSPFVH